MLEARNYRLKCSASPVASVLAPVSVVMPVYGYYFLEHADTSRVKRLLKRLCQTDGICR